MAPTPGLFTGSGPFTTPEETELKYPKVGSILDDLIARVEAGEISAEDAAGETPLHRGESVAVRVYLSGNVDGVVRFLQDNGVSPRHVGEDYIVAFIPILLLPQTSEQPGVLRVEESIPGKSFQSATRITGNGPAAHGSPAWNQAGYRGQGIKVGIIDDGFEGFSGLMGRELPQSVRARCYPNPDDSDTPDTPTNEIADCDWDDVHGTAVAESVMDIAPEVSLYIANVDTPDDVQAAVEWMIDQEVHVINHSMGWPFDGLGDGTSQYTWGTLRSVDQAVEEGIVWVNSAGNAGRAAWFKRNPSYATMTISGEDVRVILFYEDYVGTGFHAGSLLQLRWEDSWQSAASDLALFIIEDPVGNPNSGTWFNNRQQGNNGDIPRELFAGEGIDAVFIAHLGGEEPDWVQLVSWEPSGLGGLPTDISSSGSITNPAESANPGMLTVGAAPWDDVDSIEDFSSRGPTPDGRIKPDLVGADCGETASGDGPFCGTSQASPHVAGMAALVRQRFPDYSPEQVVSYLKDNAQQRINSPNPNNTWGHGFIVLPSISTDVASISDLVVDTPTVDTSAPAAGTSFTLNATVRNQGNGASVSTTLRYFLSTDSTITTGDTEVGTDSVSSLDASESGASSITLTAPSTPGTYYYGACVDAVSDESDTTNNCSLSVAVTVGAAPAPDLVVDAPTVDTSAPAAGTSFTLNAAVRNQGSGASVSTTLRYFLSTDSTITTGDTEVDTDPVSSLDASESGEESIGLDAPDAPDTYYYGACVDSVSDESDTTNNCSLSVAVTVGAAPAPDLVVDAPTVDTSAPAAGTSFTLNATVRNQGNGASVSTTLRYYQSTNSTITTDDTVVGTNSVSSLDASESGDESIGLDAPDAPGTYYYGACVDAVSDESDTTNNCSTAVTVTVGAAPAPDLVVDTPAVDTGDPAAGARFTLSATLGNQGNGPSGFTTLRYYQSTDSTITTSDTEVGTDSVSRLDASESGDESIGLDAPDAPGTYYYGACVDAVSDESDTTNNCSTAVTVTVGAAPAPDLVVDAPTVDTGAPAAGARFTLSATLRNQGNGPSGFTTLRYYQSTDSTITTGDTEVDTHSVSSLDASGSGASSISLTAPSTPGTYYYGACVDAVSDESDTTNNCSLSVAVTVGAAPAPDLVVDTPMVSEIAPAAGARFTLSATLRNQGNGPSGFTTLRYYQSTDSTITTSDTEVGTDSVSRLDASESGDESISLDAPSAPGTYYYGACVDSVSDESDTTNNCSTAVTVTVSAAPGKPANQRYSWQGTTTVVSWDPSAGAEYYNIYHHNFFDSNCSLTFGRPSFCDELATNVIGTSYTHTSPDDDTNYYWITACNSAGCSAIDSRNPARMEGSTPAPDLVVDTPTVSESAPTAGASFTLNATVRNQGNGSSAFTTLRYYRSTDSTITAGDTEVGTDSVSSLNPSGSGDKSIGLTAPSTPGTYYYGACVDSVSDESDTTNNCSAAVTVTVGAAPAPDVVLSTPRVSASTPTAGASFNLSVTAENQGSASSQPTTLRFYRSTDSTISSSDTQLGTHSVPILGPGGGFIANENPTAPTSPGTYYYGACVDAVSDESDTTNNCSPAVTVTVDAAPAPDLVVDTPTVDTGAPTAGTPITLSATVRNQGSGRSDSTTLRYYRSTDSTITTGDTEVGTDSVSSLDASESGAASISLTAPATPGTYHYGACVDAVSDESDTNNNCSPAVTVTVGSSVSVPGSATGLTATANGQTQIDLSWIAPSNDGGAAITGYKIEVSTNGSSWSDLVANTGYTTTSYSHTGLTAGSTRYYRVSAINPAGTGQESNITDATTDTQQEASTCAANNPGLVSDCDTLLAVRDTLAGTGSLNWSANVPIGNWDGITVGGTPQRVTRLELRVRGVTRVTGTIPAELGNLPNLEVLSIYGASTSDDQPISLTGKIPAELRKLTNLKELTLHQHQLSGTIPVELGDLVNLETLNLNFTQLTGAIPAELGDLIDLKTLNLYDNDLTGTIPVELGNLNNLETLNFSLNRVSGTIPTQLGDLSSLETLAMGFNQLSGTIPTQLGDLSNLETLAMGFNQLSGTIPTQLGNLTNLKDLSLGGNQLTGTIPSELGDLTKVNTLLLDRNRLTGTIPTELSGLTMLRQLQLSGNQLTGCISAALREVGSNDLAQLGLANCGSATAPDAPTGLSATADGQTEIDLLWSAPSDDGGEDITGYKIEVSTDGSSWSDLVANTGSTGTSYSHTGLTEASTRHYRVSAINSAGTSQPSSTDSATTDSPPAATAPGAPTGLSATADGQTEIDLSWTAPSDDGGADITGYKIEVSTNGSSWSALVANTRSTGTSYSHTGLTEASTRHYRVSAINSAGTSQPSSTDSATTDDEPVSDGTCTVDLIVEPGESCTYPGTSTEFSVDPDGTGRFLLVSSGTGISIINSNINGVMYTFVASKQSDGNWLVEEVG